MTAVSFFFTAVKKAVLTLAVVTLEKTFKVEKNGIMGCDKDRASSEEIISYLIFSESFPGNKNPSRYTPFLLLQEMDRN